MIATGITVEYNPFHNGHLFHLREAKSQTGADVIIAVMSGQFLQRGEPAIVDKWTRTKMALAGGADVVIELPYAFATAHATQFAKGAIQLLDAAGCSYFCFGSEQGSIAPFTSSLDLISQHRQIYEQTIQQAMKEGLSYPNALRKGYEIISSDTSVELANLAEPNNILGFQYMQAAREIQSSMKPVTIERTGTHYHDTELPDHPIASATSIRKSIFSPDSDDDIHSFLPAASFQLLNDWQEQFEFQSWDKFYPLLRYTILREGPGLLSEIADISEGIEFAFFKAAKEQPTFQSFMQAVKSKRYTWTRIQRMLVHILTGCRASTRDKITEPAYLRLLGMSEAGRSYLQIAKKKLELPLVSRAASLSDPSLELDIKSTDIYMCGVRPDASLSGLDYRTPPILL
ncbi:nucleotidyltransferase [Sporosarcina sp.]|uniref:nucleotidyltransferase n=1 Tax=Sporosarcina sp. TaxID=49982 RepID=UPI0026038A31|nr:nucleotidyltransferase [Sporosarcina sp.]